MRFIIVILVSVGAVVPGFATVDPDPDQIGVYFDSNSDITCVEISPNIPFWAYVVITNPSSAEVWGVEFGLCVETTDGHESLVFTLHEEWWYGPSIHPVEIELCGDGVSEGWGLPLLPVGVNAVVMRLQYLLLDDIGLNFYLGPVTGQSVEDGLPAYIGTGGVIRPLGISSGATDLPVASVNGCSAVAVEGATFGELKCLFR